MVFGGLSGVGLVGEGLAVVVLVFEGLSACCEGAQGCFMVILWRRMGGVQWGTWWWCMTVVVGTV